VYKNLVISQESKVAVLRSFFMSSLRKRRKKKKKKRKRKDQQKYFWIESLKQRKSFEFNQAA